jgi:hypothetical protein
MAENDDIQHKISLIENSKYDLVEERGKGFLKAAGRSFVTFGAMGALAGLGIALFSAAGAGAIVTAALTTGAIAATITGGLSAMHSGREAKEKNQAIEDAAERLRQEAKQRGITIAVPEPQPTATTPTPATQERPKFLNDIIENGKKVFDPKDIVGTAINDARETFRR